MTRSPQRSRLQRRTSAELAVLASALERAGLGGSDAAIAVAGELAVRRALLCQPRANGASDNDDDGA
jgi:hypothetical protein